MIKRLVLAAAIALATVSTAYAQYRNCTTTCYWLYSQQICNTTCY